jgi:hypothetical protein
MQCPLCAGPLHIEQADEFACERGHRLGGEALAEAAAARVTIAFWMAIEALESEAEALRVLAADHGGDEELAEQAADDARVLRDLASAHLRPLQGVDGDGS